MANSPIRLVTESELRSVHTEIFVNTTQAVTKVSDNSVLAGVIAGNAKTAKKAIKDIALSISHLFLDTAFGSSLDTAASVKGISPRFGASQSSTYVRLKATPGTTYTSGVHTFSGKNGIVFDLQVTTVIPTIGYAYAKIRSQTSGLITNVAPYTITTVSPVPAGHVGVINEYTAIGGNDLENDDLFRQRIKDGVDVLSRGTLDYLTQAFIKTNSNVLRVNFEGINSVGKVVLGIVSQNGIDFTANELNLILQGSIQYLSLTELNAIGTVSYGVMLKNVSYYTIDVNFRMSIFDSFTFDDIVKEIQIKFSKLVDFRFWDSSKNNIQWSDLLNIIKNTKGVNYVPDQYFYPNFNIVVPANALPRFRGFVVYDLNGNIQINQTGTLQSVFYTNLPDPSFALTVL